MGRWSRRDFMRAAGISGAALGLSRLTPVTAQTEQKRLIIITNGAGTDLPTWRCEGTERNFELSYQLNPFESIKDKLIILDGIDNEAGFRPDPKTVAGHDGVSCMLSGHYLPVGRFKDGRFGWPMHETIDQTVAKRIGQGTPFQSYHWGTWPAVRSGTNQGTNGIFFHRGNEQPIDCVIDPRQAFDELFSNISVGDEVDPEAERRRLEKRSILDILTGEITRLKREMPEVDRDRMEAHLEGIRSLENRLSNTSTAMACTVPSRPQELDFKDYKNVGIVTELQFEMMAHAMACDLTRVGGFSWTHVPMTGSFMSDYGYENFGHYHAITHDMSYSGRTDETKRTARQHIADLARWRSEMIMNHLIGNMTQDVFDNTLILWTMDMSEGGIHSSRNAPQTIIQGNNINAFDAGRMLKFGNFDPLVSLVEAREYQGGVPMNKVLVSIANAMGLDDITTMGDTRIDNGPLMELMA